MSGNLSEPLGTAVAAVNGRLGPGTVLLVEDEESIRLLARLTLELYGYSVLEAGDAEAALAVADQHAGPIDLLVTDLGLPGISGLELAERLRHLRPGLGVLYTSGSGQDALRDRTVAAGALLLPKPFGPATLTRVVGQAIAVGRGGPAAAYCGLGQNGHPASSMPDERGA